MLKRSVTVEFFSSTGGNATEWAHNYLDIEESRQIFETLDTGEEEPKQIIGRTITTAKHLPDRGGVVAWQRGRLHT
nr:hypothetical protein [Bifidobacterium indicum]